MTGEDSHVRCVGPCARCTYRESCRPHIERIAVEHAQHVVDVTRAGGDPRFVPRLVLECGAGQFSPKRPSSSNKAPT